MQKTWRRRATEALCDVETVMDNRYRGLRLPKTRYGRRRAPEPFGANPTAVESETEIPRARASSPYRAVHKVKHRLEPPIKAQPSLSEMTIRQSVVRRTEALGLVELSADSHMARRIAAAASVKR